MLVQSNWFQSMSTIEVHCLTNQNIENWFRWKLTVSKIIQECFNCKMKVVLLFLYGFIFVCGTIGNCFVIKWFVKQEERKKAGNKLVIVLAINDFLSSIFVPLQQIHDAIRLSSEPVNAYYIGRVFCHSLQGIQIAFLLATSFLLVAISLERYR